MSVEERDHRKHPAVVVVGLGQPELGQDAVHVLLNGSLRDPKAPPDAGVGAPFGHQREHVALATGELLEGILDIPRRNELLNQSGSTTDPPRRLVLPRRGTRRRR